MQPRATRTQAAVRAALSELDRAVSAQELYRLLHERGAGLGLASIYRALDGLANAGQAERIRRGSEDAYVLCPAAHHHHAICRTCGRVDLLRSCAVEHSETQTEAGFQIDSHQTVFYGRCPRCARGDDA